MTSSEIPTRDLNGILANRGTAYFRLKLYGGKLFLEAGTVVRLRFRF